MKFDKDSAKKLDSKAAKKILLKGGKIFNIFGIVFFLLGIFSLIGGAGLCCLVFIVPSIVLFGFGISKLFLKGEKREKYLTSKLVSQAIEEEKKNGNALSKEEIDKIKFEYDPIFHDKVVEQVHKTQDSEYSNNVKKAENKVSDLQNARQEEIKRLYNQRWNSVAGGNLQYNLIEGKININNTEHLFSSIKGAEVNKNESYRVVTTNTGKSKKHVSLGKAVVGGALLGPIGAVAGGAMGKTTTQGNSQSDSIPTCNHIGVVIDIDGFKSEVILLNKTVDQSSSAYTKALQNAEEIVSQLHYLANQPVPKTYTKIEDEDSVHEIEKSIEKAQKELEQVKENTPTYDIPKRYLNK